MNINLTERIFVVVNQIKGTFRKRKHKKGERKFCLIDQKVLSNLEIRGPHYQTDASHVL